MTEPYATTDTVTKHVVQEWRDGEYWYETRKGEPESMAVFYKICREDHPERVYRVVEEITYRTRTVTVEPNEPGKPKTKKEKQEADDAAADDGTGSAADSEGEDAPEDGEVPGDGVQDEVLGV